MRGFLSRLRKDENGQAIVEYVLTLATIVTIVLIIGTGFRRSLFVLWETIAKEVAAACPGCPADPNIRLR